METKMKKAVLPTSISLLGAFDALFILALIIQVIDASVDGGRRSYNFAEAALHGARWTSIVAQILLLMLINIIAIMVSFLPRLIEIRLDLEEHRSILNRLISAKPELSSETAHIPRTDIYGPSVAVTGNTGAVRDRVTRPEPPVADALDKLETGGPLRQAAAAPYIGPETRRLLEPSGKPAQPVGFALLCVAVAVGGFILFLYVLGVA
jgi:hypothetical protein